MVRKNTKTKDLKEGPIDRKLSLGVEPRKIERKQSNRAKNVPVDRNKLLTQKTVKKKVKVHQEFSGDSYESSDLSESEMSSHSCSESNESYLSAEVEGTTGAYRQLTKKRTTVEKKQMRSLMESALSQQEMNIAK